MLNIEAFRGQINDLDTHIQPSPHNYEIAGGEVGRQFSKMYFDLIEKLPADEAKKIIDRSGAEC
jgi:hypothetical protein